VAFYFSFLLSGTFMKRYCLFVALLVSSAVSAATITPQNGVELLFVNGAKVENKRESFDVENGPLQLIVKYSKKLKDSGKERVYDSGVYVLDIDNADTDLSISIKDLFSYGQANAFFKSDPQWLLTNSNGHKVNYNQEILDKGEGIFPYYDMPKLVKEHNQARGKVVGSGAALAANAQDANATIVKVDKSGEKKVVKLETSNLDQLKAWYLKSSKQERKEFRRWMIDQE
jgi:uncharacterized protein YccT (UPF0319 family)